MSEYGMADRRRILEALNALILVLSDDAVSGIAKILYDEAQRLDQGVEE